MRRSMPIPWEISAALAGTALLALVVVAGLTLIEIRRTLRNVMELSAATERHLPAIRQNLDEINRNASALSSSILTLSGKVSATGEALEGISRGVHLTVQSLEADVIEPGLKAVKVLSTLFAFGAALRRIRHPLGRLLMRKKGRA
jgi:uncharacterized protein YoxC